MKNKCSICYYEWEARVDKPKECPNCKSRNWNKGEKNDNNNN